MKDIGHGVVSFDTFEEMSEYMQRHKESLRDAIKPFQRQLLDSEEHFALELEPGDGGPPIICAIRVLSYGQFVSEYVMKYLDPEYTWGTDDHWSIQEAADTISMRYGEDGAFSYGYLPAQTWDSIYQVDDPDPHDRHAAGLIEIPERVFHRIRSYRQDPALCRDDPEVITWIRAWVDNVAT